MLPKGMHMQTDFSCGPVCTYSAHFLCQFSPHKISSSQTPKQHFNARYDRLFGNAVWPVVLMRAAESAASGFWTT